MNCYVCSRSGKQEAANGICRYCGIALCAEHLADLQKHNQAGCTTLAITESLL